MQWTEEQQQAIYEKGSNILVAAAAGSGKTAVLVERIVNKIINEKIDIDKILVVTFTNLAAGQMRERILDVIYKKIEENPEDMHLQKQITLLPKANICTIDSFCLDVVKNNFFELDISPNFRIADEVELKILKQEALEELFENKYENKEKEFLELIDIYTTYRGDENLKNVILKIYNYIQSSPYPKKWLKEQVEKFNITEDMDFSQTQWGNILFNYAKEDVLDAILRTKALKEQVEREGDLPKILVTFSEDFRKLQKVYNSKNWQEMYEELQQLFFDRWAKDKEIDQELNDELKNKRDKIKEKIDSIKKNLIIYDSKTAITDVKELYHSMKLIEGIINEYDEILINKKKEKNIVDFSDIEHYTLQILIKDDKPTQIALKYREKFNEIAIDEYQDSNMVQEYILNIISNNNNIFMVGDVKQSIYKFRQARPELFLEKYDNYKLKNEKKDTDNLKIKLFKNFRSRKEVLDITNLVFETIMSKEFGEIEYDEGEYLNLGATDYPEGKDLVPELHIINTKQENDEEDTNEEPIENVVIEAKFVANKIKEMINNGFEVCDKEKKYRKATYKDFVILLRNTKNVANIFEKEMMALNIPVFCDATSEYLNSYEIQIIMNLLKVIDNPLNDISQITILRSMIGEFTDNELIKIRRGEKNKPYYNSLKEYIELEDAEKTIKNKIENYLEKIDNWRAMSKKVPLDELIWTIYIETGFYNYVSLMTNGEYRTANLKMLFEKARQYEKTSFKGLYNFINFIDKLQITSGDTKGAKIIGENENVVRIMSIHKSKGLEFPIVFISCTSKSFNIMDINQDDILLHNDLGLGPKFIDNDLNLKLDTLARKAIAIKEKQELTAEELRILYVALTRAKEKLIITGIEKDREKSFEDKKAILECYNGQQKRKINKNILKKYNKYLDYLELIYLYNEKNVENILKLYIHNYNEIIKDESSIEVKERNVNNLKTNKNEEQEKKILEKLNWKYGYLLDTKIETKSSVSKLKNKKANITNEINFEEPKFLKDEIKISSARKGTLMHLILQNISEKENYTIEKITKLINSFVEKEIITQKEAESINTNKIYNFTQSDIFKELQKAKKIYREQPFYINVPAKLIYEQETEEKILVQGIIDLYHITENDEIVLLDYKTDFLENNNENILKEKYEQQLQLYKFAIEHAMKKKIDKIYIYSTFLDRSIKIL